jgi:hypothetical protein
MRKIAQISSPFLHPCRHRETARIDSTFVGVASLVMQVMDHLAFHDVQCPSALTSPLRIWHVPQPPEPALKNPQPRQVFFSSDERSVYSTDLRNATSAPLRLSGSVQPAASTDLPLMKAIASDARMPIVNSHRRPTSAGFALFEVNESREIITQRRTPLHRAASIPSTDDATNRRAAALRAPHSQAIT